MAKRLILGWLPLLAACSSHHLMAPVEEESEPPGTDEAKVVFYRDSFRNATKPYAILDDEEMLGFIQRGAWFEARCTPGDHLFYLHGVSSGGVRAKLEAGRTYFMRIDSDPELFHLQLVLCPIVPGMKEWEGIAQILKHLEHQEPIDVRLEEYAELHADDLEKELARLWTDRYEELGILGEDTGR